MKATGIGALVIWTPQIKNLVKFYQALGLPLETEEHDEVPVHYACELGSTHFAIYEGKPGTANGRGIGGSTMIGFQVSNLEESYSAAKKVGAETIWEPRDMPWGRAAQIIDPDGRAVELNQV